MRRATTVEWRKLVRSPVVWVATGLMVVLLPAMALGFYHVGVNGGTGPLAAKARAFVVEEGWEGYLGMVDQIAAVAMFLGSGIVVAWAFGREHSDRTFASLFALPVSRSRIALAKFLVLSAWTTVTAILVAVMALLLGLVGDIAPLEGDLVVPGVTRTVGVALSASLIALTVGYVASVGRGYLPAIGAIIILVAAAQVAVLFGTGQWFPYAIPGLMAVAGSEGAPTLSGLHFAVFPATIGIAMWLTIRWWRTAEVV